jgi:hypothetical protein
MGNEELVSLLEKLKEIDNEKPDSEKDLSIALDNNSESVDSGDVSVSKYSSEEIKKLANQDGKNKEDILKYLRRTSDYSLILFFIFAGTQASGRLFLDRSYTVFDGNGMDILITVAFAHTISVVSVISYHLWKK